MLCKVTLFTAQEWVQLPPTPPARTVQKGENMEENKQNEIENENVSHETNGVDMQAMLDKLKDYQQNYVKKEVYEKKCEENAMLVNALGEEREVVTPVETSPEVDLDELRNSLFNQENTNLQYAQKALLLRNELIKRGEQDPFLPAGTQIQITQEDIDGANRLADVFQHCIDYAQGDSEAFTNELQRLTKDSMPFKRR